MATMPTASMDCVGLSRASRQLWLVLGIFLSALADGLAQEGRLRLQVGGLRAYLLRGLTFAIEIKMIVLAVLALSEPRLEDGKYTVVDPLNATSVAPVGTVHFDSLRKT